MGAIEGKITEEIRKAIKEPPYLFLLFVSCIFIIFSIVFNRYFGYSLAILLYAIIGDFWRQFIKDIKKQGSIFYSMGNLILFILLINFIFYCLNTCIL